jgi:hypothetical protein
LFIHALLLCGFAMGLYNLCSGSTIYTIYAQDLTRLP